MSQKKLFKNQQFGANRGEAEKFKDSGRWRDLISYWIFGMCNNYGYVIMLSAAHDIIKSLDSNANVSAVAEQTPSSHENERICQAISVGAILLADIIPALAINLLSSFLPFYMNVRVFVICFAQFAGYILVAFAQNGSMAITGVALTSFSSGLGEVSFLAYSSKYHKNVISTWSSGTGGAGIFGSFSYAALISLGLSPVNTILLMSTVPLLEAITFWGLLRNPNSIPKQNSEPKYKQTLDDQENGLLNKEKKVSIGDKMRYMPSLMKYLVPFLLIFFFQYFINQGLLELIYFKNIWLDHESQYRWLQFDYQVGVFISRSSVNLIKINKIWLLTVFQFINVVIVVTEVLTYFLPTIWIVFGVVLWEGLLSGSAYVNTYYKMSVEISADRRKFALGVAPVADAIGIALAGILAIPAHNAICKIPMPIRI